MKSLNIFTGKFTYSPKCRSLLVDILKPLIPRKNLTKYNLSSMPITIVNNMNESDCFVLPYCWSYYLETKTVDKADMLIRSARNIGKKILIWVTGDFFISLPSYDNIIGLYTSPYRSKTINRNIVALPIIIRDPLCELQRENILINQYPSQPIVGFCGQVDLGFFKPAARKIQRVIQAGTYRLGLSHKYIGPVQPPTKLRKDILDSLVESDQIRTDFIRRDRYKGGIGKTKHNLYRDVKEDFVKNIQNTDYTICVRGTGNFSARFYETLALGRTPIFINTDCILPFDDSINWDKQIVQIDKQDIPQIGRIIFEFNNSLSAEKFIELQKNNRKIWEDYFRFSGFMRHLTEKIRKELSC